MECPEERDKILSRIRLLAADEPKEGLTVEACIDRWFSEHYEKDWQECLNYLVEEGELKSKGDKYFKEETMEKKVYKPLVATADGRLVSIWAGGGEGYGVSLEYREGEITYDLKGGAGIWICKTLEEAKGSGMGSSQTTKARTSGVCVVHKVVPLGEQMGAEGLSRSFAPAARYPAILLGKEVWREKSNCKFKVGDRVIVKREGGGGSCHKLESIFTISKIEWEASHKHYHYYKGEGTPADEDTLELAPEWVDVTKECEVEIIFVREGYYISVSHEGEWLIEAGLNKSWTATYLRNYKIEDVGKSLTPGTFSLFRVFKKCS